MTIGGHSTTDLFLWSKRFDDHEFLKFTWLLTPRGLEDGLEWLPYVGIGVLLLSVSGIWLVLKKDALAYSKAEELMPEGESGDLMDEEVSIDPWGSSQSQITPKLLKNLVCHQWRSLN